MAWAEANLRTKWHLDPYPAVWPQQTWAEICGGSCAPWGGAGSASNTIRDVSVNYFI